MAMGQNPVPLGTSGKTIGFFIIGWLITTIFGWLTA
jgi:hypothetical protein